MGYVWWIHISKSQERTDDDVYNEGKGESMDQPGRLGRSSNGVEEKRVNRTEVEDEMKPRRPRCGTTF